MGVNLIMVDQKVTILTVYFDLTPSGLSYLHVLLHSRSQQSNIASVQAPRH